MARTVSPEFIAMTQEQRLHGEDNDCSVKALAMVTGVSYQKARAVLASLGRKPGEPTKNWVIMTAVKALGKTPRYVDAFEEIVPHYPGIHKNKKRVTTHQPARFPQAWKNGKTYLAFTNGHVLAIVDGVVHDWTSERSIRINSMEEIT